MEDSARASHSINIAFGSASSHFCFSSTLGRAVCRSVMPGPWMRRPDRISRQHASSEQDHTLRDQNCPGQREDPRSGRKRVGLGGGPGWTTRPRVQKCHAQYDKRLVVQRYKLFRRPVGSDPRALTGSTLGLHKFSFARIQTLIRRWVVFYPNVSGPLDPAQSEEVNVLWPAPGAQQSCLLESTQWPRTRRVAATTQDTAQKNTASQK